MIRREMHERAMASLRARLKDQRFREWMLQEAERTAMYDQIKCAPRVGIDIPFVTFWYGSQN